MPAVAIKHIEPEPVALVPPPEGEMIDGKWKGKWRIHDPRQVKHLERTDFLKGLVGQIDQSDSLEEIIRGLHIPYVVASKQTPEYAAKIDLQSYAETYYMLRNKGARLPKFSRWITGMFAGSKEFAKILADEGQKAAARKIVMSVDVVDILRCADTPHFQSCFKLPAVDEKDKYGWVNLGYDKIPVRIAEECPGIGIVYVDDENGFMMGRHWMHHAKIKETGEDMIVLTASRYGCLEGANIARLLANKLKIKVGVGGYYHEEIRGSKAVRIEYVGCFTKELHHDLSTWHKNPSVMMIEPAF